jgi:hypothetical protein
MTQVPSPAQIAAAALQQITATWRQAAEQISAHPDLPAALAAAGQLGAGVRALYDAEAKPLRGRQVARIRAAAPSDGRTIRKLAERTSLSRSTVDELLTAADQQEALP